MVGRMGYPVFLAVRTSSISGLTGWSGSYHEAWKAAGHPGRGEVGVIVPVYVAETARQAREDPEASAMHSIARSARRWPGPRRRPCAPRPANG